MRWEALFADLEAQLEAEERWGLEAEVADRTRRERAAVGLHDRLAAAGDRTLVVRLSGGSALSGTVADVGRDWLLLAGGAARPTLVPFTAVLSVTGLGRRAAPAGVARRFGIGAALRVLSRDRATVALTDTAAAVTTGTIDAVGSDYLELSEHPADEPRRAGSVVGRRVVPFSALACVAPA